MAELLGTLSAVTYLPVADKPQPSATPGLVVRNVILNYTAGSTIINYSGPATGMTEVIWASAVPIGTNTDTFSVTNTVNGAGVFSLLSNAIRFTKSGTTAGLASAIIISRY